ncbi:MAG: glycosyltransferase, partial [Fulvivirga sp.]|nr:glycosyltransferase [Fulvivirga sp.]
FLYTSKRESFGMPILESMACGTPVITSKFSCMPEIANEAAILVDTNDPGKIGAGIEKILSDEELYNRLVEKGFERAKKYNWDKAAYKMLSIYEEFNPA